MGNKERTEWREEERWGYEREPGVVEAGRKYYKEGDTTNGL